MLAGTSPISISVPCSCKFVQIAGGWVSSVEGSCSTSDSVGLWQYISNPKRNTQHCQQQCPVLSYLFIGCGFTS